MCPGAVRQELEVEFSFCFEAWLGVDGASNGGVISGETLPVFGKYSRFFSFGGQGGSTRNLYPMPSMLLRYILRSILMASRWAAASRWNSNSGGSLRRKPSEEANGETPIGVGGPRGCSIGAEYDLTGSSGTVSSGGAGCGTSAAGSDAGADDDAAAAGREDEGAASMGFR